MTAFASLDDVEARWRPLTDPERLVADTLLDDASAIIRARFPGVEGQVDDDILAAVTAGMVKRALIAPLDGVSQESETTGPYSHSTSFANPMRNVFLTAADEMMIVGYQPAAISGRFSNTSPRWS